jgi:hypothetical protein
VHGIWSEEEASDLDMNANKQARNSIARELYAKIVRASEIEMETVMRIRLRLRNCECDGYEC